MGNFVISNARGSAKKLRVRFEFQPLHFKRPHRKVGDSPAGMVVLSIGVEGRVYGPYLTIIKTNKADYDQPVMFHRTQAQRDLWRDVKGYYSRISAWHKHLEALGQPVTGDQIMARMSEQEYPPEAIDCEPV